MVWMSITSIKQKLTKCWSSLLCFYSPDVLTVLFKAKCLSSCQPTLTKHWINEQITCTGICRLSNYKYYCTTRKIDKNHAKFYLLKIAEVLLHLRETWGLLMQFPLQSYQVYVLLYVSPATVFGISSRLHCAGYNNSKTLWAQCIRNAQSQKEKVRRCHSSDRSN